MMSQLTNVRTSQKGSPGQTLLKMPASGQPLNFPACHASSEMGNQVRGPVGTDGWHEGTWRFETHSAPY